MPDILHTLQVRGASQRVFDMFATPAGLDAWWTARSRGTPVIGTDYQLWFAPDYDWRARVTACDPGALFELEFTTAMQDWLGTRVRAELAQHDGVTTLRFAHVGWPRDTEHYRVTSYCWAMYLRLLRRHVEFGVTVPYEQRLDD